MPEKTSLLNWLCLRNAASLFWFSFRHLLRCSAFASKVCLADLALLQNVAWLVSLVVHDCRRSSNNLRSCTIVYDVNTIIDDRRRLSMIFDDRRRSSTIVESTTVQDRGKPSKIIDDRRRSLTIVENRTTSPKFVDDRRRSSTIDYGRRRWSSIADDRRRSLTVVEDRRRSSTIIEDRG